jgi:spermidine synthase
MYGAMGMTWILSRASNLGSSPNLLAFLWKAPGSTAALLLVLAGACAGYLTLRVGWRLPQASPVGGETLVAVATGREGVVATVRGETNDLRILFNNTYTLGGSRAAANQERQAHLPLLLHGHARSMALLGVATGSTLAGATLHRGLERIEAAELSPLTLAMARDHFSSFNRNVFADSRVRVRVEDARWLAAERRADFDVVVGDLFLPWRVGEGRLYSLEHFEAVRRSLRAGGLFCQWLPMYQLTRPQFEVIARTFLQVFPNALLLRGDFYADLPIVGLVGGRRLSEIDWSAISAGCERLRSAGETRDPLVRHAEGVAMMLLGELPTLPRGKINTLANNWLEWDAGRNILGLGTPWFIGVPAAEWMREIHRAAQGQLPERWRSPHDAGQFFLTLDVALLSQSPLVSNFRGQIRDRMPLDLWMDPQASWPQWPSREKPRLRSGE